MTTTISPLVRCSSFGLSSRPFVLLVDDDETGRDAISRLIDDAGHHCVPVGSGIEALKICETDRPCLVITDLCMPGLDGQGLAHRLRSLFPGLGLILITAQPLNPSRLRELLTTFDDVLPKPLEPSALLDRIRQHVL